ncbi:sterol desaturase family protein [Photobacterium sp. OFAV2-7]|uniref:sterol desaturase family protein n=1 Tax=Photobacterium sp. OFAV2-7 TaxID=2917748 RepID=UPI001EF6AF79|nr:sterol desaturase family protein [Photobacterium sp. OFAV2-7]MCG7584331.1 sterol desaturase family protein [Photobacterium sp. OFAV2-7]
MDFMSHVYSLDAIMNAEAWIDDHFLLIALALFLVELVRYRFKKQLSWTMIGDSATNFVTLFFLLVILFVVGLGYVGAFLFMYDNFSLTQLPVTGWTVLGCLILADLAYYWEHRFLHSNGLAWGTHSVHHSSPFFNISVAYRFGPLDWFFPFFFYLPLVLMGFHPFVVLMCETLVQLFQTLLHTETVKKLPRPIEAVFNTPSHHRVHHATNQQYLDKNYAGILIVWDRMFGTFAREEETVRYGVYPRINSVNPLTVYFHGYGKLAKQLWHAPSWCYRLKLLAKPPIWAWQQEQQRKGK